MVDVLSLVVSALASAAISTLVSLVTRRDEANIRVRSELAIKTQEANLRQMVEQEVQKARGEVERELKTHEIRLRVEADLRLKLADRMLSDVAQFRAKLFDAFNLIYRMSQEAEPRGDTPRFAELVEETHRAFAAVPSSAAFMPPELLEEAIGHFHAAHDCFRAVVVWAREPAREQRTAGCNETSARIEAIGIQARQLFAAWQQAQFSMLLGNASVPVAALATNQATRTEQ